MESVTRVTLAALLGSILLVVPIVLWATLGDGDLLRSAAVVVAAVLVSSAVVRQLLRPLASMVPRVDQRVAPIPRAQHACGAGLRRPARVAWMPARGREIPRPATCRAGVPRRSSGSRLARDVRCGGAAAPLTRRSARRRTRP